ncbi:hypothetical protein P3T76_008203 [Phytophthora citrophthora]|uniref:NmrA-like domain-containing protein n=1 Tax=Phytophthora citrophthora TaxID=4793 RepID=A0AAD9GK39_9STRA|nr:hypothetical protein P3T76_008203 [Phytophthora citrophthora]
MSAYTNFVIIGAGGIGGAVADELLKNNHQVTILTRDESTQELQAFKARGAALVQLSYNDEDALKKALSGSEVLAVSPYYLDAQKTAVRAAKAAGIQLFVPAEYCVRVTEGLNAFKKVIQDLLTELQLPFTIFYTRIFAEFLPSKAHAAVPWVDVECSLRMVLTVTTVSCRAMRCLFCFGVDSFLDYHYNEGGGQGQGQDGLQHHVAHALPCRSSTFNGPMNLGASKLAPNISVQLLSIDRSCDSILDKPYYGLSSLDKV